MFRSIFVNLTEDFATVKPLSTQGHPLKFVERGTELFGFEEDSKRSRPMNPLYRIIKADNTRKTRFHTSNGHLCLNPLEIFRAVGTSFNRVVFQKYARAPWLTFSAIRYLQGLISGRRVFEFGSGMSTLWFAERCREVVSVESNPTWYEATSRKMQGLHNVRLIFATSREDYIAAIERAGGLFDLILVDGLYREQCIDLARTYLSPKGVLVVDNTDTIPGLSDQIKQRYGNSDIRTFRGWVPGNLHPNETTIIEKIAAVNEVSQASVQSR
jgi:predicted O-methyltransferase YrrM